MTLLLSETWPVKKQGRIDGVDVRGAVGGRGGSGEDWSALTYCLPHHTQSKRRQYAV